MALGMEVDIGLGHIVLDGDRAPPRKGTETPNFRPISFVAKRLDASRCHLFMAALCNKAGHIYFQPVVSSLWSPCVIGQTIIFLPCGFYLSSFFSRLISAVGSWMSTILPHMVWP